MDQKHRRENKRHLKVCWLIHLIEYPLHRYCKNKNRATSSDACCSTLYVLDPTNLKNVIELLVDMVEENAALNDTSIPSNFTEEIQSTLKNYCQEMSRTENDLKRSKEKLAEANKLLFENDGYVQLEMAKSLLTNTNFTLSGDQSALGSVVVRIMGED